MTTRATAPPGADDTKSWRPSRSRSVVAIVLLGPASLVCAGLGWIVGVVLLWSSPLWSAREKWTATLCPPFGLSIVPALFWFGSSRAGSCEAVVGSPVGGPARTGAVARCVATAPVPSAIAVWLILAVVLVASVWTSIWLTLIARRRSWLAAPEDRSVPPGHEASLGPAAE